MRTAIVIGATSGIGAGLANILTSKGYRVGITGRRNNLLESLQAQHPSQIEIKQIDVTAPDCIEKLNELAEILGKVDLIVLSSGTGDINENLDFEIEKRTIDVNVLGFTAIVDWAFRYFEQQGKGHLVAITSVASLRGAAEAPAYNATKAYQANYLEALSIKAAKGKFPITVTDIRPGFVDTDMAKGEGLFWVASVEEATAQLYKAIEQKKRITYITKRWSLVALLLKALPYSIYKRI